MPYTSNAQRRFFHTDTARAHGISPATVNEFDQASRGLTLPAHAAPSARANHAPSHHAALAGLRAHLARQKAK